MKYISGYNEKQDWYTISRFSVFVFNHLKCKWEIVFYDIIEMFVRFNNCPNFISSGKKSWFFPISAN